MFGAPYTCIPTDLKVPILGRALCGEHKIITLVTDVPAIILALFIWIILMLIFKRIKRSRKYGWVWNQSDDSWNSVTVKRPSKGKR